MSAPASGNTQDIPLLRTKLFIPPIRPEFVSRPRLVDRLGVGLDRKLTLVSAPAGFGKTTLLSECAARCGRPVAWVSLDKNDNDPVRFWRYVVAALQRVQPDMGTTTLAMLSSSGIAGATTLPSADTLLTGLINEAAGIPAPFVLVLDDIHLITEPRVHEGLAFLVDHLPSHMHLVLCGRADPPWPLSRLRARGELTELRSLDLRFTRSEAQSFLNEAMGLDLSQENVAALDARTEGWIAGLQMAAISMRERSRAQGARDLSGFVEAFTGSHRFVLDYLVEEVLEHQPPHIRDFLLQTSILERMTASLCDAVTGRDDSQRILLELEQDNLFLIPMDHERHWYRYHHLFADLLRSRLEQAWPGRIAGLHLRAGEWYEKSGLIAEAVGHALAANDFDRAAGLIEGHALSVIYHPELTSVVRWLDQLPGAVVHSRPWLCVAHAWALVYAGQMDAVESRLRQAEETLITLDEAWTAKGAALDASSQELADRRRIKGHIATIRSYAALIQGDITRSAELARDALAYLPGWDWRARSFAVSTLGSALDGKDEFEAASRAIREAIAISRPTGDRHLTVVALCQLAGIQYRQGRLHEAAATCHEAQQVVDEFLLQTGRPMLVTGYLYARLAQILYQWNDLQAARDYAQEGIKLCRQWGIKTIQPTGYLALAKVLQATGDQSGALNAIQSAKEVAAETSPWLYKRVEAAETEMRLANGDVAAASQWAQESGLRANDDLDIRDRSLYFVLVKVFIAQGRAELTRLDQALELCARLLEMAEKAGALDQAIRTLILQALALQAQGRSDEALASLERTLALAEPGGYVRVFIEEGVPISRLLRRVAVRQTGSSYVDNLLAALDREVGDAVDADIQLRRLEDDTDGSVVGVSSLLELLSERELEVLQLLSTNRSTSEIAERLYISTHTVRSHTKSIYSKLNVHSRIEAVARARELGILR